VRFEQVIQPSGRSSFLESHQQTAAQPAKELQNRGRFRFEDGLQDQLTGGIHDRNRDRCLVNVHANILCLVHNGARVMRTIKTYRKVGAFYIA
jgi:hypothetical protein